MNALYMYLESSTERRGVSLPNALFIYQDRLYYPTSYSCNAKMVKRQNGVSLQILDTFSWMRTSVQLESN